ncbi:MAG: hypothetical protein WC459_03600 [Patescibacteria group bacterium]
MRKKLLIFSVGDSEGASAILPVIKFLENKKSELNFEIMILADMSGTAPDGLAGIFYTRVAVDKNLILADHIGKLYGPFFDHENIVALVCDTSHPVGLKARLTELAKKRGVPVIWLSRHPGRCILSDTIEYYSQTFDECSGEEIAIFIIDNFFK